VADTEEEAWRLFASRERAHMDRNIGRFGQLLPPEQAVREYSEAEQAYRRELRAKAMVGTAAQVAGRLRALAEELEIGEIAVITWTWDPAAQRRSYELLAREFGLA
jgi:alkanesulfonate monooxygenase SsuD/methylene tetrahydromethanopterin reductase-like flavin-dependent oxidoreductase (luciferase family)